MPLCRCHWDEPTVRSSLQPSEWGVKLFHFCLLSLTHSLIVHSALRMSKPVRERDAPRAGVIDKLNLPERARLANIKLYFEGPPAPAA